MSHIRWVAAAASVLLGAPVLAGCSTHVDAAAPAAATTTRVPDAVPVPDPSPPRAVHVYRWHTHVVSTTFWVGEIFDPNADDGSQVLSTYDGRWMAHYGGCDGVVVGHDCRTEARRGGDGYWPEHMTPQENPFYLDVPFDDVNNRAAFRSRCDVVPWANRPAYRGHCTDPGFSYLKNRWVALTGPNGATCYGQVEDAGPGQYDDASYVFGDHDARPANRRYGSAGMDVSPALNGCLGFAALDGDHDQVSWRFVDGRDVPPGPWRTLITRSPVEE